MKDYKIGYFKICNDDNKEIITDYYFKDYNKYFIENTIKHINDKYNLDLNIIIVDDYTKEECDLVVYEQCSELYNRLKNRLLFQQAKGSPKFLMYFWGEPHSWPHLCSYEINQLIQTFDDYVPMTSYYYKVYSITMYEDTKHNCCMPYYINTCEVSDIENKKEQIIKNKKIDKINFCSMMFSHGTKERDIIYNLLNEYKTIRCFGNYNKNMGNIYYEDDVMFNYIMPTYKFNICFENCQSYYNETYVTEKICNAFKSGTIPIYWGNNKQIYEVFNKDSFINLTDVPVEKWVDIIKEYDNNDDLYYKMLNTEAIIDHNVSNRYFEKKEKFIVKVLTEEY
jgi:hypothetical protein